MEINNERLVDLKALSIEIKKLTHEIKRLLTKEKAELMPKEFTQLFKEFINSEIIPNLQINDHVLNFGVISNADFKRLEIVTKFQNKHEVYKGLDDRGFRKLLKLVNLYDPKKTYYLGNKTTKGISLKNINDQFTRL